MGGPYEEGGMLDGPWQLGPRRGQTGISEHGLGLLPHFLAVPLA